MLFYTREHVQIDREESRRFVGSLAYFTSCEEFFPYNRNQNVIFHHPW